MKRPPSTPIQSASMQQLKDEERYLLSCYRSLRTGQQMVLVELAALMAETAGASRVQPSLNPNDRARE